MTTIFKNVLESALELHKTGHIDTLTMREFDELCLLPLPHFSPDDIRRIRNQNHVSQSVFAKHINVKTITVAAW